MKDEIIEKIKNNQYIRSFCKTNNINTMQILQKNAHVLNEFINSYKECVNGNLSECKQDNPGYCLQLEFNNQQFYIASKHCAHWIYENQNYKILQNIILTDFVFNDNECINLKSMTKEQATKENNDTKISTINKLSSLYTKKNHWKGIYLYGPAGIGKTHIFKAAAISYAQRDRKVVIITINRLFKELKESFSSMDKTNFNKFYNKCMEVDILMLDDIGGEVISEWSRDEILFGLLNYRMENKKPTFFNSNFSLKQIQKMYAINNDKIYEKKHFNSVKSIRLVERIKVLADEIEWTGENLRNSK